MKRLMDSTGSPQAHRKPVIGILGGICSGKSTVAAEFARLGCKVIDADKIAHQILDKKAVSKKLIKLFGQKISGRTGKISRRKLAKIVFADLSSVACTHVTPFAVCQPPRLSTRVEAAGDSKTQGQVGAAGMLTPLETKFLTGLNKIIHPLVLAKAERLIKQYERLPGTKAIVLDMPLLVEVGWHKRCDKLIFVNCSRQKRLKRAEKMGFFAPLSSVEDRKGVKNQFKWRENFQISLDKKARISDNTIDNNSDLSALVRQVAEVFSRIVSRTNLV